MRVVLLPAAREDLVEIWRYGVATWSMDQADRYSDALDSAIRRLADNPFRAPPVAIVAPGIRRLAHQAHAIFYRVESDEVLVLRILHQSRDAGLWVG